MRAGSALNSTVRLLSRRPERVPHCDPTPRKEKTDRMTRLLKAQDDIAMALVKAQVGQTVRVLVEGYGRN